MDNRWRQGRSLKWCSLLASVAFLTAVRGAEAEKCSTSEPDRFLMLVSTLDGRVTALDVGTGVEAWTVSAGARPLLSSSITNMEITRDGTSVRLIPSLDGGLYQYDGSGIEPVPLAADVLLSNSFRFSDDSTVVGGKEVENYGIDMKTGQLKYICSSDGCENFTLNSEDEDNSGDTLVITRHTRTVRAMEMLTGHEKWNFSVGEHDVAYVTKNNGNVRSNIKLSRDHQLTAEDKLCTTAEEEEGFFDGFNFDWFSDEAPVTSYTADDLKLRVIVPSGMVIAVLKSNPSQVIWQQKFGVAIANAWLLKGVVLQEVNLFDNQNVPALSVEKTDIIPGDDDDDDDVDDSHAVLYVGVYDNQVYVQPSYSLQQEVNDATTRAVITGDISTIHMPRVHWKPYLATAFSRTPIMPRTKESSKDSNIIDHSDRTLVPFHVGYPFDDGTEDGVYLLQDYTPMPIGLDRQIEDHSVKPDMSHIYMSQLLDWWRELFAISLLTVFVSIMVHLLLMRISTKHTVTENTQESKKAKRDRSSQSESQDSSYSSRYYNDFEQLAVLGHGGFGVVFQSKNKLDDCHYAVKRIALNNSETAMEKVRREVKALATLDHPGIVRYHHSWFESPPPGWQEKRDKVCLEMPSSSGFSVTEQTPAQTRLSPFDEKTPIRHLSQLYLSQVDPTNPDAPIQKLDNFNPLKPFSEESINIINLDVNDNNEDDDDDDSWVIELNNVDEKAGSSGGFVYRDMKFNLGETESEESDDCSSTDSSHGHLVSDDSGGIIFQEESEVGLSSSAPLLPFHIYDCNSTTKQSHSDIDFAHSSDKNCKSTEHAIITISNASGDSNDKTSKSHNEITSYCRSSQVKSNHRRAKSCDLTSSLAKRPEDLPLRSKECQTQAPPDAKLYLYIQMQLCKRESLKDWLNTNKENRDRLLLLDIFYQIVSAMEYVHDRGLMHRDLKPSNIFFSMEGLVKIGDFGLVTALEETALTPYGPAQPYGRHTSQVGTRLYMSPEQHAGMSYTHKIDIYALGLIFFELFYQFDTQMERIHIISNVKRMHFPDKFVQPLSKDEVLFIKHMLSHNPEQRPSCKAILSQPMFSSFDEIQRAYLHARARSSSRIRTYSTSSNKSASGSGSQSTLDHGLGSSPDNESVVSH